jgi:hypothetical protein
MKPLGLTAIAAGTIAAIALFTFKEKAKSPSTLPVSAEIREVANAKTSDNYQSLIAAAKAAPYNQAVTGTGTVSDELATNITAAAPEMDMEPKSASMIFSPIVSKSKINTAKLSRRLSITNGSIVLVNQPIKVESMLPNMANETNADKLIFQDKQMAGPSQDSPVADADIKQNNTETILASVPDYNAAKNNLHSVSIAVNEPKAEMQKMATVASNVSFASSKIVDKGSDSYSYTALLEETQQLQDYAQKNGYNTEYAIIANLGIKQGKKRFFVVDLNSMTILKNGIVAQGKGDSTNSFEKRYSNEIGSAASALGIYKIGRPERENNYLCKLYGLEESNSNAVKRNLTLQGSDLIPYSDNNYNIVNTDGSLSISSKFLKEISNILDQNEKPVLLWVFDPTAESHSFYSSIQK